MAALLEKLRDHRTHPVMTTDERETEYGVHTPTVRRASLKTVQQQRTAKRSVPKATTSANQQNNNADARTTEDLEDEPATTGQLTPIPIKKRSNGNKGQAVHQIHAKRFPWKVLVAGISIPLTVYTVLFLVVAGWILLTNTMTYGPTHTTFTRASLNGQASTVVTSNVSGTIYVTIITNKDGSAKTYTGPTLNANAWNGDMNSIVANVEVARNTVTIHLIGGVNYFHLLFTRPTMTFCLVPTKQANYKIVVLS